VEALVQAPPGAYAWDTLLFEEEGRRMKKLIVMGTLAAFLGGTAAPLMARPGQGQSAAQARTKKKKHKKNSAGKKKTARLNAPIR
jgi:hypothetical protein